MSADTHGTMPDILILGMHRSGTSALTLCLQALGYGSPATAATGNFANGKGYGESRAVSALNNEILELSGRAWSVPAKDPGAMPEALSDAGVLSRIASTLRDEFAADAPIALKDPRISLMPTPWIEALEGRAGKRPVALFSLRDPREVVQSLARRDRMNIHQALVLYSDYLLSAERHTRELRRTVVAYTDLLKNPLAALHAAWDRLGMAFPKTSAATRKAVKETIDPSLRHHRPSELHLGDSAAAALAMDVFEAMQSLGASDTDAATRFKPLHRRLKTLLGTFGQVVEEMDAARRREMALRNDFERLTRFAEDGKHERALAHFASVACARLERDDAQIEIQRLDAALRASETKRAELSSRLRKARHAPETPDTGAAPTLSQTLQTVRDSLKASGGMRARRAGPAKRFRKLSDTERKALAAAIDEAHYSEQVRDAGGSIALEPVLHYLREGAAMGLSPHPLFDPEFYATQVGAQASDDLPPYADFIITQNAKGVKPHPLFDPDHYLRDNADVARAGIAAHVHYHQYGWKEARTPNTWFYPLWYISQNPDVLKGGDPLLQYALLGEAQGYRPHPSFDPDWYRDTYLDGDRDASPLRHYLETGAAEGLLTQEPPIEARDRSEDNRRTLLCVAHSATERLFGSERSFLDVLGAVDRSRYRIVAVLPKPKPEYVDRVAEVADVIQFTKRRWWSESPDINADTVRDYERMIDAHGADAVYVNTIMLREPLVAARSKGVPAVCHVREAIALDPDLCEAIGLSADAIIAAVRENSDVIIANSSLMVDMFGEGETTYLVHNAVNVAGTLGRPRWRGRGTLVAGALSSNIPKKGIADIVDLAAAAQERGLDVVFKLFGPHTEEVTRLEKLCKRKRITNVEFPGYVEDARQAVAQIDVILNFSHFAESFGRTIVEGGAAARPSIVYDHGALPEVVEDGVTGVVIPYKEPLKALDALQRFIDEPDHYKVMGEAARVRAEEMFSHAVLAQKVNAVFGNILDAAQPRAGTMLGAAPGGSAGTVAPVSVIVPNYNYEDYLPERLRSIMEQTRPPAEIIFLDDASPDDSVAVAEEILAAGDIPYRILASEENQGVYKQWLRGLEHATQPWIWIAEADDSAEDDFLEKLLSRATDDVNVVYAQSQKIDGEGHVTAPDNRAHSNAVSPTRWSRDYVATGTEEVLSALAFRNTIPNASAVLLRREAIRGLEDELLSMRYVGDWLLYVHMMRTGGVAFVSEPLNKFRRHQRSVTRVAGRGQDYLQELARIRLFMARHFPLGPDQLERMDAFLDKDFKIDGVKRNSEAAVIADMQAEMRRLAGARRHFGFITTNNGSWYGGSEMLWREAALALRADGHEVDVLIRRWDPRPDFFDAFEAQGIRLHFKEEDGFAHFLDAAPDLTVVSLGDQDEGREFYSELQSRGLDYVVVNQLTKEARFWPVRQDRVAAVTRGYQGAKQAFFTSWNNHRVMEDRLATPLPNGAIHFNPYHIDRSAVPDWPSDATTQIAIPSKLLFIHKGQDILLEFLGKKEWQRDDLHFNFFGIGPDEDQIRKRAKANGIRNLTLHGRVSDISEIWQSNHALLMPSRMEGLPIMLVSAMLSARVPILTDIGGHAEVVTDNETGFIAPDPNAQDVEDALRRALARRDEWEEIGRQARAAILDFLPEDPVADFTAKLMELVG